jgi:hypothetical protein
MRLPFLLGGSIMADTNVYKMFDALTNYDLKNLIQDFRNKLFSDTIKDEIWEQQRPGHQRRESQYRFLNRMDLLIIIYGFIKEEIKRIDEAPLDQVPLLINEEWPCPQLTERVKRRLMHAK